MTEGSVAWRCFAPAKLNLYLHVTGRRADGYHLLDSLVAFASIGDFVTVAPADRLQLSVTGPFAGGLDGPVEQNLVWRAAMMLADRRGVAPRAAIVLEKNLPVASGIGGGSSDVAASLRGLAELWRIRDSKMLEEVAAVLGSDVPACLAGRAAWLGGIGEIVAPVASLPSCGVLLVNPRVPLATPDVYRGRREPFTAPARFDMPRDARTLATLLGERGNDLTASALRVVPVIADVLTPLGALDGVLLARMSGSGATCFALFEAEADAQKAAQTLAAAQPDWWIAPGKLLDGPAELSPARP